MNRVIITIIAICSFVLIATACSNETPTTTVGTYTGDKFEAVITKDAIEIHLVNGNTKSLYWAGTWDDGKAEVVSKADREALDESLLGSGADSKVFTIDGDNLEFEFKMMGATTDVSLGKE